MKFPPYFDRLVIGLGAVGASSLCAMALVAVFSTDVSASPSSAVLGASLARANATGATGFVDSFSVSCGTSATLIAAPSGSNQAAYYCQTPASAESGGTALVAVGDSGINSPAFATRNSPVYSGDTIREFYASTKKEYCRVSSGTVTIFCRAVVTSEP